MRAAQEGFGLEAPELLEAVDEFGDGIGLQILSVFPTFVLQQTRNSHEKLLTLGEDLLSRGEYQQALAEIRVLSGLLPVCAG